MKRVLVIPSWYGSAELPTAGVFFKEQALLVADRYDIRILLIDRMICGRRQPHLWLWPRLSGPQLRSFSTERDPDGLTIHRAGVDVANRWRPGDDRSNKTEAQQLLRALRRHGWLPEVVHCHCAVPAGIIGMQIATQLDVPLVVTEHQHIIRDYFTSDEWAAARTVYSRASKVAAVSEFERQMMLMNGARCEPVIIGNLVDEAAFPLAESPSGNDEIRLLFIGMASPLKDYATFFRALALLSEATSARVLARIVCADRPPARAGIEAKVKQLSDAINIEIIASASRTQIAGLVAWSSMLVSTSIAETFGVAIGEALMCGRPVVTTASGGISDFVIDGWNGYIVRVGDAEGIVRRICDVIAGKLRAKPHETRAAIASTYGREAFAAKLAELYEAS